MKKALLFVLFIVGVKCLFSQGNYIVINKNSQKHIFDMDTIVLESIRGDYPPAFCDIGDTISYMRFIFPDFLDMCDRFSNNDISEDGSGDRLVHSRDDKYFDFDKRYYFSKTKNLLHIYISYNPGMTELLKSDTLSYDQSKEYFESVEQMYLRYKIEYESNHLVLIKTKE